jgi:uncharacterized membrane protein (UPF0127 family)
VRRITILLGLVTACSTGSTDDAAEWASPVAFDSADVVLLSGSDSLALRVEVARTQEQRSFGLMTRPGLAPEAGMLFLHESRQDTSAGFWMFRTLIPLDIAFIDSLGTIVDIQSMDPCTSPNPEWCREHKPAQPYFSALEVNRGFFEARGFKVGDRVLLR